MALKIVPTATNPMVASTVVPSTAGSFGHRLTLKNRVNSGKVTSSTEPTKARLASSLPRNSASRETGANSRPSSAAFSRSMVNARFIASNAASAKVTHKTLGASAVAESAVGSRAKLKTTRTRAAKTSAERRAFRLRSSARTSLPATARTKRIDLSTGQHAVPGDERIQLARSRLIHRPTSLDQHRHPGGQFPHIGQLMGHYDHTGPLLQARSKIRSKPF